MRKMLFVFLFLTGSPGCAHTANEVHQPQRIDKGERGVGNDDLLRLADSLGGPCNPVADPEKKQYLIGYGSLMQETSRRRSVSAAGVAYPVRVKGYRRGWFAQGDGLGFGTTYLGLVPETGNTLNAVIFELTASDMPAMDKREFFYCRLAVNPADYALLHAESPRMSGQAWIYVNKPDSIARATPQHPIVQSYVDIFVSGCLEQEEQYALQGFSSECLATTSDWSRAWVNDRVYPRRPFIYQPKAMQIDKLLQSQVNDYFRHIYLE